MSGFIPIGSVPAFHAARDPDFPFFTQDGVTVSRGHFEARANRRARALAQHGIGQDDRVIMLMPNGVAFFETSFALWKLGATPVPASPNTTAAELKVFAELVEPRAVIGQQAPDSGIIAIPADLAIDPALSAEPLGERMPAHWRINMSGGSTGRPKVIVDRTPAVADPLNPMLEQRVDGVMLNPGPLYHSGPFGLSHRAVFAGNHIVNMSRFDALGVLGLIEQHGVDWLYIVPTMMHRIWRLPEQARSGHDLSSLRTVFQMGAACPQWLKQNWIDWLGPEKIWELYSGAENPGRCVINGTEWLAHRGSVGKVQPGAELAVFDEAGEPCATGAIGEIGFKPVSDDFTFRYIGAEPKMFGDFVSLGDLGYLDEDGYLYLVDRRTDMIVSGGVNVYPAEIEGALEEHPGVESCIAIGLPDADLGNRVHAIVHREPQAADKVGVDELRAWLGTLLVGYKIPRSFEFVDAPLRDNAGKARRSALREERANNPHFSR